MLELKSNFGGEGNGGIIHVNIEHTELNSVVKTHYNYNMDAISELIHHIS